MNGGFGSICMRTHTRSDMKEDPHHYNSGIQYEQNQMAGAAGSSGKQVAKRQG